MGLHPNKCCALNAGMCWGSARRLEAGLCDKRECSHTLLKIVRWITGDLESYHLPHFSTNSFLKMDYRLRVQGDFFCYIYSVYILGPLWSLASL